MLNPSIKRNLTGIGIVAEGHHTVGAVIDRAYSVDALRAIFLKIIASYAVAFGGFRA